MNSTAAARDVSSTRMRASAGRPADEMASRMAAAMARLEVMADDEPRRKAALPDLRQRPAASEVTLGRLS